jgi:TPP-dependent 2-oxoacid decarboxylase
MLYHQQPVYIGIPTDVTFEKIRDVGLLVTLTRELDPNPSVLEGAVISEIRAKIEGSKNTVVIIDGGMSQTA